MLLSNRVLLIALVLLSLGTAQAAVSYSTNFSGFALGTIYGQNGWAPGIDPGIDQAIISLGGGQQGLRISNSTSNGAFANQVYAPAVDAAGETPTGAPNNVFQMSMTFKSFTTVPQSGLDVRVGPYDFGGTNRQGLFGIVDSGAGLDLYYYDSDALGVINAHLVVSGLSYTALTSVDLTIHFFDGLNNDTAQVVVNGGAPIAFTSWETFYPFDLDPFPVSVNTVLFRMNAGGSPPAGQGIVFTNLAFSTSSVPEPSTFAFLAGGLGVLFAMRKRFTH